ncbi:MAG: hypothetical protein WBD02_02685 [Acidimicrobiia bacterium]
MRFRISPSSLVALPVFHSVMWSVLALVVGASTFAHIPLIAASGAAVGLGHASLQWATSWSEVASGELHIRNMVFASRRDLTEIEAVYRVRRRRWQAIAVVFDDGKEVVLPAPVAATWAPNHDFDEEVRRFCAAVALAETTTELGPW